MKSIATRFFATAAIFVLAGMAWGIQMSATGDHLLSPAHAHLNLIGFVIMAVYGAYYALTPAAAGTRMAELHYWLHTATVIVLVPGIVLAITERGEGLAITGSFMAVLSMVLFLWMVLRYGVGASRDRAHDTLAAQPAE